MEGIRMMAASSNNSPRRRRYARDPSHSLAALTPVKLEMLGYVARYGIVTSVQLTLLAAMHPKAVQRQMRALFDAGLVEIVPAPRAALAGPGSANDAGLLFGSAPNIYTLTKEGFRVLEELGLAEVSFQQRRYGPLNTLFLAHTLAVRDFRVWLELCGRQYPGHLPERWRDGKDAHIALNQAKPPHLAAPDAWFVYRLSKQVLVGLVEVDRGTERGGLRWKQKLEAYGKLFASGRLKEVTGYSNARVLVVAPDARRRDGLADLVREHAPATLAARFWLAERSVLARHGLAERGWRQPGGALTALVPPELLPAHRHFDDLAK